MLNGFPVVFLFFIFVVFLFFIFGDKPGRSRVFVKMQNTAR